MGPRQLCLARDDARTAPAANQSAAVINTGAIKKGRNPPPSATRKGKDTARSTNPGSRQQATEHPDQLLKYLLRQALASTKRSQVYLEIFSGSGRTAAALNRKGRFACIALDTNWWQDVTLPSVSRTISVWLQYRVVRGLMLGMPCSSFSAALFRKLRNKQFPRGRPDATDAEQMRDKHIVKIR